jgi:hypothetical protein
MSGWKSAKASENNNNNNPTFFSDEPRYWEGYTMSPSPGGRSGRGGIGIEVQDPQSYEA